VVEAVFILFEFPSPSRRIFIGSHSLPPSLVRRIGPSKGGADTTKDLQALDLEVDEVATEVAESINFEGNGGAGGEGGDGGDQY
jgi:hypothetical protein